ncbi:MAG: hypothetical protein ACI4SR_05970 [Faecalibacillus sp.]
MEKYIFLIITIVYVALSFHFIKAKKMDNIFNFTGLLIMSFIQTSGNHWYNYACTITLGLDFLLMLIVSKDKIIKK